MIRDEDLKSSVDYSEGQKRAAHRVLVELVNIFEEYEDEIRVVGGWVPDLMFPQEGHVGSVDVDIMINHLTLQDPVGLYKQDKIDMIPADGADITFDPKQVGQFEELLTWKN